MNIIIASSSSEIISAANKQTSTLAKYFDVEIFNAESLYEIYKIIIKVNIDMLISDIDFADGNIFEFTQRNSHDIPIFPIIILTRDCTFDSAYKAIRAHVSSYLRFPNDMHLLCNDIININNLKHHVTDKNTESYKTVDKQWADNLLRFHKPLDQFNKQYGLKFQNGIYLVILLKFDTDIKLYKDNIEKLIKSVKQTTYLYYKPMCYEILFDNISDGVLTFLNYSNDYSKDILNGFENYYNKIKIELPANFKYTLCISREYSDYSLLLDAKYDVLDERWARHRLRNQNIIRYSDLNLIGENKSDYDFENKLRINILRAFRAYDEDKIYMQLDTFFKQPASYLSTRNARKFITSIIYDIFEIFNTNIDKNTDDTLTRHQMFYDINMSSNYYQMNMIIKSYVKRMLNVLNEVNVSQYSETILKAIRYINTNYQRQPTLNEVANYCGRSTAYFSVLFKEEVHETFSQYLIDLKLSHAKRMLKDTSESISSIAIKLGYDDVRNFSKFFHREMNMTPTQYRNIFK